MNHLRRRRSPARSVSVAASVNPVTDWRGTVAGGEVSSTASPQQPQPRPSAIVKLSLRTRRGHCIIIVLDAFRSDLSEDPPTDDRRRGNPTRRPRLPDGWYSRQGDSIPLNNPTQYYYCV